MADAGVWPLQCTGDAATCMAKHIASGHKKDTTKHGAPARGSRKTFCGLWIREFTIDEFQRCTSIGVTSNAIGTFVAQVRHVTSRGPLVAPMSGTPLARTYYDPIPLLQTQMVAEWYKDEVLKPFTESPESLAKAYNYVTTSIANGKVSTAAKKALRFQPGEGGESDEEVTELTQWWRETREPAVKLFLQQYLVRYTEDTTMNGMRLMPLLDLRKVERKCRNPDGTAEVLAVWRDNYGTSSKALAALNVKRQGAGGSKGGKKAKSDAEGNAVVLNQGVRLYMMGKDFPALAEILGSNTQLLMSRSMSDDGIFKAVRRSFAFQGGNPRKLYESSGKARMLADYLLERWTENWQDMVTPASMGTVDQARMEARLDPVLVTVYETGLAPVVHAAMEYRFLGIRVESLMPGQSNSAFVDEYMGIPMSGDGEPTYKRPIDILILPVKVAGNGLNLTASNLMVQIDVVPVGWMQEQILKRDHRCGQTRGCTAVQLLLDDGDDLDARRLKTRVAKGSLTAPLLKDNAVIEIDD
ncbi:hypothetical protein LTR56_027941 [Elasticomyces elasticus]|nr:hypothetical protein LTR56_027941 [Elasticomyces elasticus]